MDFFQHERHASNGQTKNTFGIMSFTDSQITSSPNKMIKAY